MRELLCSECLYPPKIQMLKPKPRRDGKNTQKNGTKKDIKDSDNHDGVINQLEPDILECEVISVQFSSLVQLCLTLCYPTMCSTPGLPVYH